MSDERRRTPSSTDVTETVVFKRISDAVFAVDDEWRFTFLNEPAARLFERPESELVGEVVWEALPESVASAFRDECERAMTTQTPASFETRFPASDGWFEVRAYPSESGLSVCLCDVTDRVRSRRTLRRRERALQDAYEIVADADRSFSEQIDALLDVVSDAVGTDYATLSRVRGDEYVFEAVTAPEDADLRAGDTVPLEATNCERVVGTERTLVLADVESDAPELADRAGNAEWGISCYLGAPVTVDGDVYGSFCFYDMEAKSEGFSDWEVTLVNLLSNWVSSELERRRENERLESFASMVAHELRNPLAIAQIYHRQAARGDPAAAEEVAAALGRIEEMVDVLLVTARGSDSTPDCEPVALADVAAEAWTGVEGEDAELAVETTRTVEADPIHLRHMLENLFRNAVEHAGRGITVEVGDLPTGFYVADDGPGIPAHDRRRVFEPGFTTDAEGIGLGLTFVGQLADTYGWTCAVTESDAGGARFEFTDVTADGESGAKER